jgi:hypothetical protein
MLTDDNSSAVVPIFIRSFGITRCTMQVCCFHPNTMLGVDHDIIIFIRCMCYLCIDVKAKSGAGRREGADSRHGKTGRGGRQTHTVIVFCRLYTTDQTKKKKNYTNYFFSYARFLCTQQ